MESSERNSKRRKVVPNEEETIIHGLRRELENSHKAYNDLLFSTVIQGASVGLREENNKLVKRVELLEKELAHFRTGSSFPLASQEHTPQQQAFDEAQKQWIQDTNHLQSEWKKRLETEQSQWERRVKELENLVEESRRQVQEEKARWERESQEVTHHVRELSDSQHHSSSQELKDLRSQLNRAQEERSQLESMLKNKDSQVSEVEKKLKDECQALQHKVRELESSSEKSLAEIRRQEELREKDRQALEAAKEQLTTLQERERLHQGSATSETENLRKELEITSNSLRLLQEEMKERQAAADQAKTTIDSLQGQVKQHEESVHGLQELLRFVNEEKEAKEKELEEAKKMAQQSNLEGELQSEKKAKQEAEERIAQLEKEKSEAEETLSTLRKEFDALKEKLEREENTFREQLKEANEAKDDITAKLHKMKSEAEVSLEKTNFQLQEQQETIIRLKEDLKNAKKKRVEINETTEIIGEENGAKKTKAPTTKAANPPIVDLANKKKVIAFSGFKEQDPQYNVEFKDELVKKVEELNGEVRFESEFDNAITHVVTVPNCRTMKTLAAALTARWLVSPEWIVESAKAGQFLPEDNFGKRFRDRIFKDVTFYISDSFTKENRTKPTKMNHCRMLIEKLGKGKIVESEAEAQYAIIGSKDNSSYKIPAVTWNEFIDKIPGLTSDETPEVAKEASPSPPFTSPKKRKKEETSEAPKKKTKIEKPKAEKPKTVKAAKEAKEKRTKEKEDKEIPSQRKAVKTTEMPKKLRRSPRNSQEEKPRISSAPPRKKAK